MSALMDKSTVMISSMILNTSMTSLVVLFDSILIIIFRMRIATMSASVRAYLLMSAVLWMFIAVAIVFDQTIEVCDSSFFNVKNLVKAVSSTTDTFAHINSDCAPTLAILIRFD